MAVSVNAMQDTLKDPLVIAGKAYASRLLVGTGKYKDMDETRRAVEASGAQYYRSRSGAPTSARTPTNLTCSTSCRRRSTPICLNTAGCYSADDAVRTCRLARELLDGHDLVKLEVLGDEKTLYPDIPQTLKAAEILIKDGDSK